MFPPRGVQLNTNCGARKSPIDGDAQWRNNNSMQGEKKNKQAEESHYLLRHPHGMVSMWLPPAVTALWVMLSQWGPCVPSQGGVEVGGGGWGGGGVPVGCNKGGWMCCREVLAASLWERLLFKTRLVVGASRCGLHQLEKKETISIKYLLVKCCWESTKQRQIQMKMSSNNYG